MEYEIVELRADGSGYAVIFTDDGKSHGQQLRGMPVDDKQALEDAMDGVCEAVAARVAAPQSKQVSGAVAALIGARKQKKNRP